MGAFVKAIDVDRICILLGDVDLTAERCIVRTLYLTSFTVLDYCTIHMLMTHNYVTIQKQDCLTDNLSDIEQCVSERERRTYE